MAGKTPPNREHAEGKSSEQHKPGEQRKPDQGDRRPQPDTQNRPIEVPGRPDADRMTERKPAYGPGGGQPQDDTYGTEASENPGGIDTPYADDDMSGRSDTEV